MRLNFDVRSVYPPSPLLQAHVFGVMTLTKHLLKSHTYPYFSRYFTRNLLVMKWRAVQEAIN